MTKLSKSKSVESKPMKCKLQEESKESELPSKLKYVRTTEFESISGRMAMMGNQTKYMVSCDEVNRRMGAPECMNSSSLAGLLRRSKTRNGGEEMRQKMKQHGMDMNLCRRRGTNANSITGLSEGEMFTIFEDLDKITEQSYPVRDIARHIVNDAKSVEDRNEIVKDAQHFMEFLPYLISAMDSCQPPLTGIGELKSGNEELDRLMGIYSSHTHGLGPLNQRTWANQLVKIGKELGDPVQK